MCNTVITILIAVLSARLGFLAVTAVIVGSIVIQLGPARLRSLPRSERKIAAVHLLAMLGAAAASIIFNKIFKNAVLIFIADRSIKRYRIL